MVSVEQYAEEFGGAVAKKVEAIELGIAATRAHVRDLGALVVEYLDSNDGKGAEVRQELLGLADAQAQALKDARSADQQFVGTMNDYLRSIGAGFTIVSTESEYKG